MKLRVKAPKVANEMASGIISKKASEELGGECHIRFSEVEIGMKDGKVYAKFAVDGEMERTDFMKLIKMVMVN